MSKTVSRRDKYLSSVAAAAGLTSSPWHPLVESRAQLRAFLSYYWQGVPGT